MHRGVLRLQPGRAGASLSRLCCDLNELKNRSCSSVKRSRGTETNTGLQLRSLATEVRTRHGGEAGGFDEARGAKSVELVCDGLGEER